MILNRMEAKVKDYPTEDWGSPGITPISSAMVPHLVVMRLNGAALRPSESGIVDRRVHLDLVEDDFLVRRLPGGR